MPLETRIAFAGIAKQTTKGTAVTPPAYGFGARGGAVVKVDIDQDYDEITSLEAVFPALIRNAVAYAMDLSTRLNYKSFPLLAYAALGAISTTGTNPYTHVITPAAAGSSPPRLTAYGRQDTEYARLTDCRVAELTVSWEEAKPPEVAVKIMGCSLLLGSSWTATADESGNTPIPTAGGTFKLDGASGTAVVAPISGGQITIARVLDPIVLSKQMEPDDIWASTLTVETTLKLRPDSLAEWNKAVTGSATGVGTTLSAVPVYGSYDCKFQIDSTKSVQIAGTRSGFLGDFPDVDPGGKAVEITVVGKAVKPSSGNFVTVTCINDVVSF